MTRTFYSNGKLLLTGEYVVLDGAKALAIPTVFGQSMVVMPWDQNEIVWTSLSHENKVWYENSFPLNNGKITSTKNDEISTTLLKLFKVCQGLNNEFLTGNRGYLVISRLDFPNDWGLGTSSTLVNNLANWADIDAYQLLAESFGGSGYDIACAQNETPITYQLTEGLPQVESVSFRPEFSNHLYFVHLNKKENSRQAITKYDTSGRATEKEILEISHLTEEIIGCTDFEQFCSLIDRHEQLLNNVLKLETVKSERFPDFVGSLKSLGAWGGDFILAVSRQNPKDYFSEKGYTTVVPFDEMCLKK